MPRQAIRRVVEPLGGIELSLAAGEDPRAAHLRLMIVLDTNVISEVLRPVPADPVRRWMEMQPTGALFTTTVCEAELKLGAAILPQGQRRSELENAIAVIFLQAFAGRVLTFDRAAAGAYADRRSARRQAGRPIATLDAQIAAMPARTAPPWRRATLSTSPIAELTWSTLGSNTGGTVQRIASTEPQAAT